MGMTTKFLEIKFCKTCKEDLNYKKFRKVKRLKKDQIKVSLFGGLILRVEKDFRRAQSVKKTSFTRDIEPIQFLN